MTCIWTSCAFHWKLARVFALTLIAVFAFGPRGATADGQTMRPDAGANGLHLYINILEGEGAVNNIRQRDAREPVVQVTDENHKPVSGVALLFLIHGDSGATATFDENSLTFRDTTKADGTGRGGKLHLGNHPGSITITVTASVGGVIAASAIIHQSNIIAAMDSAQDTGRGDSDSQSKAQSPSGAVKHGIPHIGKTALIVTASVVAAAVVVGVVVATRGNNSTSLSLGAGTVGTPQQAVAGDRHY
jgi:hypothetical protein